MSQTPANRGVTVCTTLAIGVFGAGWVNLCLGRRGPAVACFIAAPVLAIAALILGLIRDGGL